MTPIQLRAQAKLRLQQLGLDPKTAGGYEYETGDPTEWITAMSGGEINNFAPFHLDYWAWNMQVQEGIRPPAFVGAWPRGGGKTTCAEWGAIRLGSDGIRKFCLYVKETQDQANKSIAAIAASLEEPMIARHYPQMAKRDTNKFGTTRSWNATQLQTAQGWSALGYGLDSAARGIKIKNFRPDLIVLDDLDSHEDTARETERKVEMITKSILPAGSRDCAIMYIQNVIKAEGIMDQIVQGKAGFLKRRVLSGPYPAVAGLKTKEVVDETTGETRHLVVAGTPTWELRDLETIQAEIDDYGLDAFLSECQHDLSADYAKRLWRHEDMDDYYVDEFAYDPEEFDIIIVSVDPPAISGKAGITVAGLKEIEGIDMVYIIESMEVDADPYMWGSEVAGLYNEYGATTAIYEQNQGGLMVHHVLETQDPTMYCEPVHAARGKISRSQPVASLFRKGRVKIMGRNHRALTRQMLTYQQGEASPDVLDSMVHAVTYLLLGTMSGSAEVF